MLIQTTMAPKALLMRRTGQGLLSGLLLLTLLGMQTLESGHFHGQDNNPPQCLLCKTDSTESIAAEPDLRTASPQQAIFPLNNGKLLPTGPASQYKARAPPCTFS